MKKHTLLNLSTAVLIVTLAASEITYANNVQSVGLISKYCGFIKATGGLLATNPEQSILSTSANVNGISASVMVMTNTPETFQVTVSNPQSFSKSPMIYDDAGFTPVISSEFKMDQYRGTKGLQGNSAEQQAPGNSIFLEKTGKSIMTFNMEITNEKNLMFLTGRYEVVQTVTCATN